VTEFCEQDLAGARFDRVSLRGATVTRVFRNDAGMQAVEHRLYAERDLTVLEQGS